MFPDITNLKRRSIKASFWLWVAILLSGFTLPARADLAFHGGPVLKSFQVVPLYYGPWKAADVAEHQKYLVGLTQYISGANAPANSQTMLVQYGVTSAGAANPVLRPSPPGKISLDALGAEAVIHAAQKDGSIPAYADNRLILLLLPHGAVLAPHCAYHGSEGVGKYFALVTQDCGPWLLVTAHEVIEGATDPAIGLKPSHNGWDEAVDPCTTSFPLWFGSVPGAFDNTLHACSKTGYDQVSPPVVPGSFTAVWQPGSEPEIQVEGWTYSAYRQRYDELWGVGWRLHLLQPYVSGGQVFYNAVWRPGTDNELQVYGWTYADYRKKYDDLWKQGWRLKILQPYVVNGDVLYTAVFQPGTGGEYQVYGWTYADYRKKYDDDLWKQGWRLALLQPYVVNNEVRYTAVWRPGTEGEVSSLWLELRRLPQEVR